jgi:PAS domain S-box-containing protein
LPNIIWVGNVDGTTSCCNDRFYEFTGLSVQAPIGSGWQIAVHPEERSDCKLFWEAAMQGMESKGRCHLKTAGGGYRRLLVEAIPLTNADGRTVNWLGVCREITDENTNPEKCNLELNDRESVTGTND